LANISSDSDSSLCVLQE